VRWLAAALGCVLWLTVPVAFADAADAHYQLAKALRDQGRYEEALSEADRLLTSDPAWGYEGDGD